MRVIVSNRWFVGNIQNHHRYHWFPTKKAAAKRAAKYDSPVVFVIDTHASTYNPDEWWDTHD
jgi:hypothetical protein